jgi:hypothetical protein
MPGAPDAAVIGYDLWQSHFGGSSDVIGTLMTLGDRSWRIVGVAASGADVPGNRWSFPIVWQAAKDGRDDDGTFDVVARMRTGASLRQTRAELARASARVEQERRGTPRDRALTVTPLRDAVVGDAKHVLWIFFAAVCCVALIGIGNLIGLQLVRQASRERETALRAALGAGRWQLVRPVLVEAVLFGGAAGACGLLLAWLCTRALLSALPAQFPRADQIAVDVRVTMFAVGASLVIGAIVGAVPAWRAARRDIARTVRADGHGVVGRGHRNGLRRAMVAAETALACVLLVGAALLVNSLGRLFTEDAGMRERDLWVASGQLPQSARYMSQGRALAWWTSALEASCPTSSRRRWSSIPAARCRASTSWRAASRRRRPRCRRPAGDCDSARARSAPDSSRRRASRSPRGGQSCRRMPQAPSSSPCSTPEPRRCCGRAGIRSAGRSE